MKQYFAFVVFGIALFIVAASFLIAHVRNNQPVCQTGFFYAERVGICFNNSIAAKPLGESNE